MEINCYNKENIQFVDLEKTRQDWFDDVIHNKELIEARQEETWLLYEDDAYRFSVLFFAFLAANKRIILPQNGCPTQIETTLENADAICSSVSVGVKESYSFKYSPTQKLGNVLTLNENLLVTFFTSGSTGEPKAIEKRLRNLITEIDGLDTTFFKEIAGSCFLSTVSHQHIYGLLVKLLWPILKGYPVVLQPYEYPEHICHAITKLGLDSICLVSSPAHFSRLVKDNVYEPIKSKFSGFISSGGPLLENVASSMLAQVGVSPIEILGSTETGGIAWRQRHERDLDPAWRVFEGISFCIDGDTQRLKIDSPYIESEGWYLTDDRCEVLPENKFKLLGRSDRIVKVEEKRVSLDQVQRCLHSLDIVEDAYCLVIERKRGLQVAAVVALNEDGNRLLMENKKLVVNKRIQNALRIELEAIAMPKRFRYVSQLPYNASGKLNKKDMEKLFD